MRQAKAFTLLETLLAITIIVMILGTVYAFYAHAMTLTVRGREKLEDVQLARVVLHKMAAELRGVTASGKRFGAVMTGEADNISFITTVVPSRLVFLPTDFTDKGRIIEHDLRNVTYYIGRTKDSDSQNMGLARDELRCMLTPLIEHKEASELTPEEAEKAKHEQEKFKVHLDLGGNKALSEQPLLLQTVLSDRIKYLRFDYFNGKKWLAKWQPMELDAIPRAVKVTIGYKEVPEEEAKQEQQQPMEQRPWHEDQYSIIVSLILADDLKAQPSGSTVSGAEGEQGATR
jgi:type II secretory pathway pseudopilin PulG